MAAAQFAHSTRHSLLQFAHPFAIRTRPRSLLNQRRAFAIMVRERNSIVGLIHAKVTPPIVYDEDEGRWLSSEPRSDFVTSYLAQLITIDRPLAPAQ